MGDAEAIGVIIEDLYDLMNCMEENPSHNKECLIFGKRLLQYIDYLCKEQHIELDIDISNDYYFCYLMNLEKNHYNESGAMK